MADIAGNTTTTSILSVGGSISSTIDTVGDHDWFKISLTAGQAVDITVALGTLEDSYLNIYDSTGRNILYSNDDIVDGVDRGSEVNFDPSYTGTYYIDVSAWTDPTQGQSGDSYTGTGTYTVSAQPYTAPPLATNDQIANQLTSGYWGGDVHHWNVTQGGTLTVDIHTLTTAEQTLARAALQEWSDIIGVTFKEVTSGAQITFDDGGDSTGKNPVAQTDANWSNGIMSSANVEISTSWVNSYGTSLDSYSFQTYVHEIGHALGLGHAGNYNNDATYPYDSSFENDSWSTSIMSYFSQHDNTYFAQQGFSEVDAVTPMVADIIAMQSLYGLSTTTRTGNTVYGDHSNAGTIYDATVYPDVAYTIFDSAGNDTIDYSLSSARQLINLNPETFSNVDGYTGNLEIARGVVIENAIGGSGSDTLIGNSANNVLTGNLGADTLTGGSGNDVFSDTKSGHSGDTITDFHVGDTILFTDATASGFSFSLSGNTLTYTGGSMTVDGVAAGTFTESTAASGAVQISETVNEAVHDDFTGDGRSDILLRADDGSLTDWIGQSTGSFAAHSLSSSPGSTWHLAGTGDFNGDGHADLLWQNSDGTLTDWMGQADGGFVGMHLNSNPGSSWHLVGTGDFNGDGRTDLLWQNDDGTLTDWMGQADGGFVGRHLNSNPGASWHVIGTGDFNGDGISDILWQNDSGALTDWLGQPDGGFAGNHLSNANPGSGWHLVGTGDFNGDGYTDVLWRNDSGAVTDWIGQADGSFATTSLNTNPGTSWHAVSIGDFNADGFDDVLWQNSNGTLMEWTGQAGGTFASTTLSSTLSSSLHVQDPFVHDPFA